MSVALDEFDDLATDIIADVHGVSFGDARALIAGRLRILDAEARMAGVMLAAKSLGEAAARVKGMAK